MTSNILLEVPETVIASSSCLKSKIENKTMKNAISFKDSLPTESW